MMNSISVIEEFYATLNGIPGITVHAFHGIGLGISENYTRPAEGAEMLIVRPIIGILAIGVWILNSSN